MIAASKTDPGPPVAKADPVPPPIDPTDPVHLHSINEPHGSDVLAPVEPPPEAGNLPGQPPTEPSPPAVEHHAKSQPEMPPVSRDPDDIEDEIEAEIDEGDIEPKPKKKKK
jgi:hypothetical protein